MYSLPVRPCHNRSTRYGTQVVRCQALEPVDQLRRISLESDPDSDQSWPGWVCSASSWGDPGNLCADHPQPVQQRSSRTCQTGVCVFVCGSHFGKAPVAGLVQLFFGSAHSSDRLGRRAAFDHLFVRGWQLHHHHFGHVERFGRFRAIQHQHRSLRQSAVGPGFDSGERQRRHRLELFVWIWDVVGQFCE